MNETNINKDVLTNVLRKEQCVMISLVIISSGIINKSDTLNNNINVICEENNSHLSENIAVLNITHTDSYTQNLSNRIEQLYSQLGAKLIYPLSIWKNNLSHTSKSTGNINRWIQGGFVKYNCVGKNTNINFDTNKNIYHEEDGQNKQNEQDESSNILVITANKLSQYRINIMLDNIRQNLPRQNYIFALEPIVIFNEACKKTGAENVYMSNLIKDGFIPDDIIKIIEKQNNLQVEIIPTKSNGLSPKQIYWHRQYGINNEHNNVKYKRKRDNDENLKKDPETN